MPTFSTICTNVSLISKDGEVFNTKGYTDKNRNYVSVRKQHVPPWPVEDVVASNVSGVKVSGPVVGYDTKIVKASSSVIYEVNNTL